ncbi:MAG: MBL fold metallo-hydrolase [Candidatus Dojkabacteria bacterium]|nr:MAG: MBL fold metallo-hydrolase [Candidatus Dojkabacteria bacterium]
MLKLQYEKLEVVKLQHSTIVLKNAETGTMIVIDPYMIEADIMKDLGVVHSIFLTHDHFDHFSPKDVGFIARKETIYVFPASILDKSKTFLTQSDEHLVSVIPLEEYTVEINGELVRFMALPAYNIDKLSPQGNPYHPKSKEYVGFLIEFAGASIYIAGDTDKIPEMDALTGMVDVAVLPISGTYVMTDDEAVAAAKTILPQIVIPVHYGVVVGDPEMGEVFKQKMAEELPAVQVEIL